MKRAKSKISLLLSVGIHGILMLIISPFVVQHFNESDNSLSFAIFKADTDDQVKRRFMPQHKPVQPKRSTDSGSPVLSRAAPKYSPEMDPPKAPIYDNLAPEIVTYADIPKTDAYTLPNKSFGTDAETSGPVVVPNYRGAGGTVRGPGRGGSGTGRGGMGKRLASITDVDDLVSIDLDEGIMGLGIFDTDVMPGHGLIGQVYIPGGQIYKMPVFERMTPVYTFATAKLDVPARNYTEGFPTPQKQTVLENFAIRFRGKLAVNTSGIYMFELLSDDGAKLYINGKLVVDNDGVHGPLSRRRHIRLATGFHPVEIHYFQGPRHQIALQWYYKPPNRPRQIVPSQVIFHPGNKLKRRLEKIEK